MKQPYKVNVILEQHNQRFYLDKIDGSYYYNVQLFVYYLMFDTGLYESLLTENEFKLSKKALNISPNTLYKFNQDSEEYSEINHEMLQHLLTQFCIYIGNTLIKKGYVLNDDLWKVFLSQDLTITNLEYEYSKTQEVNELVKLQVKEIIEKIDLFTNELVDHNIDILTNDVLSIINKKGSKLNFFTDIPHKYHSNESFILAAIQNNCDVKFLPSNSMAMKKVVKVLIGNKIRIIDIEDISDDLKDDEEIALIAISVNANNIRYFSNRIKSKLDIVSIVVQKDGTLLKYLPDEVLSNYDVILSAIKQNGYSFAYASEFWSDNRDVFMLAIQNLNTIYSDMLDSDNYVGILYHASERLKDDEEIALETVIKDYESYNCISDRLKSCKSFIIKMVQKAKLESELMNASDYDEDPDFLDEKIDYFDEELLVLYNFIIKSIDKLILNDLAFISELIKNDQQFLKVIPKRIINKLNSR